MKLGVKTGHCMSISGSCVPTSSRTRPATEARGPGSYFAVERNGEVHTGDGSYLD